MFPCSPRGSADSPDWNTEQQTWIGNRSFPYLIEIWPNQVRLYKACMWLPPYQHTLLWLPVCSGYEVQFHVVTDKMESDSTGVPAIPAQFLEPEGPIATLSKAQRSPHPLTFRIPYTPYTLPAKITISEDLLNGALKNKVSYAVMTVAYTRRTHLVSCKMNVSQCCVPYWVLTVLIATAYLVSSLVAMYHDHQSHRTIWTQGSFCTCLVYLQHVFLRVSWSLLWLWL